MDEEEGAFGCVPACEPFNGGSTTDLMVRAMGREVTKVAEKTYLGC